MADVPRRVRTQAERDADGTTWRATAATRPGYATYPTTQPGSPSWWERHGQQPPQRPELPATMLQRIDFDTAPELDAPEPPPHPRVELSRLMREPAPVPPRRRWWHRYTRRNP